ncbi:hypothetical protein [Phenylobacterium sp. J367]|uniref:hypothetical protein n=1 Tax=Phenylobacterium sp. J367 TaxID=2898435 RepID=UPI0021515B53|nr:hypothetical protein [Phenylobacterium sp. J367]MCR5879549.1 hypothetical protein [Phenylobacterium sp. J367]
MRRRTGDPVPETYDLGAYFGALLASPPLGAMASEIGAFFRNAGNRPHTYTHAQRELVDQVFAADWKTNVVAHLHIQDAISAGVPMRTIKALRYGREEDLSADETLLVRYIRQVVSGTVDDATYAAVEALVGSERGIVEYTGFILWLQWIMRMMQALDTGTHSDEAIDKLIADIESGAHRCPDYRIGTATPMSRFDR